MVLAWENLQEVFVILVVVFTSLEVFYSLLLTSSLNLPWGIAGFLHPFYTFSPVHRRVNRDTFILTFLDFSVTVLPWLLRFCAGIFYTQALFTLPSFPTFLARFVTQMWAGTPHPGSSLCLPSQSCLFRLTHGLELLIS